MRIGIVGRHPDLEHGFNGVMSLYEAKGFAEAGHAVTLLLPVTEAHDPEALLAAKGIASFDALPRHGAEFEVRPLRPGDFPRFDAVVWQCYAATDWPYHAEARRTGAILTKNFPRCFVGLPEEDEALLRSRARQFHLMTFALGEDLARARAIMDGTGFRHAVAHVPRGFGADWLDGAARPARPVIGFDRPVKPADGGQAAIRHIVASGQIVRKAHPDALFLSLRQEVPELGSERIPNCGFRDFYDRFLNRLWLYVSIDFDHSAHATQKVVRPDGGWAFRGLYENQVVETQLAGGLSLSRRGDLAEEILSPGCRALQVDGFDDPRALASRMLDAIEGFPALSAEARTFARERHTYCHMTGAWAAALQAL